MSEVSYLEKLKKWTENEYFDQETREELLNIKDEKELQDRFYTDLEFGTAGLRGVLGAGTNRMNKYIVRRATKALADTIKDHGQAACDRGVAIAYDSRKFSAEFALETGLVLAANGIKAYLFDQLRPTPELSFAVRHLRAIAGVNITASHNPKEYNGYKVYWEDGGQIPPQKAGRIVARIASQTAWDVQVMSEEEAVARNLLAIIGEEVDQAYYQALKEQLLYPDLTRARGDRLKIVYTPLHGTGGRPVQQVLSGIGFSSLYVVPEQECPDCEFTTVKSPNPEDSCAYQIAIKYALQKQADIILATDPDADRLGMYAKDQKGEYRSFTGNEIGVLLEYYLLSQSKRLGKLPADATVVKTVASTDLGDAVAGQFGARIINVLVGFKYIGEQIKDMEEKKWGTFLFGFEESHGYLAGAYARDKDAVQAAALLAEAALYYQEREGKTLPQVLDEIFQLCGYYKDEQVAVSLQGQEGKGKITRIMDFLRRERPGNFAGLKVKTIEDYLAGKRFYLAENREEPIDLPPENVVRFSLQGGGFVMARPSGTEPKIRFYFCLKGRSSSETEQNLNNVKADFLGRIQEVIGPNI